MLNQQPRDYETRAGLRAAPRYSEGRHKEIAPPPVSYQAMASTAGSPVWDFDLLPPGPPRLESARLRGFIDVQDPSEELEAEPPSSIDAKYGNSLTALIYDHVRAKRMSRSRLVAHFDAVAPNLVGRQLTDVEPLPYLIQIFLERASPRQAKELLSRIAGVTGSMEDDPYLSGISRRESK